MQVAARLITAAALALACSVCSHAQNYPSKPIRLVLPFPPGGGADVIGRLFAQKLTENLGQQVIVDYRAGADGIIGMELIASSKPDGYTIGLAHTSQYAIHPGLYPKLTYDPVRDFTPITLLGSVPYVLIVHPSLPARSVKEFIALAKSHPGQLLFASPGNGSVPHLAVELLKKTVGVDIVHIPYKGGGPAILDLIAGQVQFSMLTVNTSGPPVRSGRLRALGLTSAARSAVLPDLPTIAETVPGYESTVWYGVAAPASTPRDIVDRLNAEIVRVLNTPEIRQRLTLETFQPIGSTPEQLGSHIKSEIARWSRIVKESGAKIN